MLNRKNILIIGIQGSGKGTLSFILEEKYLIPHISMGDLLRDATKEKSALGMQIQNIMSQGLLVPLEISKALLKKRLEKSDAHHGFILDGFPRNLEQALVLDSLVEIDFVFVLQLSKEVSINRILSRIQCSQCGKIYNTQTNPPQKKGICDECQSALYYREDDQLATIEKRIAIYEKETYPMIEHYHAKKHIIDGSQSIHEVSQEVFRILH